MSDPFVHLHVASGYSLRHGASHPRALVERAAEHGMDTLALTDRDGTYGAVKFAKACGAAGVRPVFGVDLAFAPVLLDPATVTDHADVVHPNALATGVAKVWVTGVLVFEDGQATGARPGTVVRRAGSPSA